MREWPTPSEGVRRRDGECCRCGQKRKMSHSAHYSLRQQLADNGVADEEAVGWNAEAAVT